jgi:hypothetical protein
VPQYCTTRTWLTGAYDDAIVLHDFGKLSGALRRRLSEDALSVPAASLAS